MKRAMSDGVATKGGRSDNLKRVVYRSIACYLNPFFDIPADTMMAQNG